MATVKSRPGLRNRRDDSARRLILPEQGFLRQMYDRAQLAAKEPWKGLTATGTPEPGLFELARTGISLQPVVDAANAFLDGLTPDQKTAATFPLEDDLWRLWSNIHVFLFRHGACLDTMTDEQRARALALVRELMSASGFDLARDVMKLNEHVRELTGRTEAYGEWYYWLSVFGTPSATEPWGWQIDGHHLIINCFVLGDQIVLTPNFMGSEPVVAQSGKYAGTAVFQTEELQGFALMNALSPEQQAKATIGMDLPFDVYATAFRDNMVMKYEGLRHDELDKGQQEKLAGLIRLYTSRVRPGHAEIRFEEVMDRLKDTWFAWIGPCDDHSAFYYRVHSPVVLIEFDHQAGIVYENDHHTRDHIHTLVRTPNGNDYGKDLLRQHYLQHDHSHPHTPHRMGKI